MTFDYDLLVLGAGSGGLAATERAATYGARVAIAERFNPGGACVNYGCIPEKLLDYAAGFHRLDPVAASYGWQECRREFSWSHFITAKTQHIHHLNELHLHHLNDAGVPLLQGGGSVLDSHRIRVGDQAVTAEKILIAVGAKPSKPTIPGIEHTITWHELYSLPKQPQSVAVVGGDPIGVKISGSLNALGSQITQITAEERILSQLDAEIGQDIQDRLRKRGVQILNKTSVSRIEKINHGLHLSLSGCLDSLTVDTVLIDAPRTPNLTDLNLHHAGIQLTASGAIQVDEWSCTSCPTIFAIGDCTDRIPLTPSAIAQGRAFADTEFGGQRRPVQLDWVPMSLSSHPEAATVGFSEIQARERFGDAVFCYRPRFRPLLYCLSGWDEKTLIKVVVNQQDAERVLGVHIAFS